MVACERPGRPCLEVVAAQRLAALGESMYTELTLRLALLGLLIVDLSMPTYFRRRAAAGTARTPRGRWTRLLVPEVVLTGVTYIGIFAYLLHPKSMSWSRIELPEGLRLLGVGLATLGLCGLFWAFRHLGHNLLASEAPGAAPTLITTGPYRWVRHPLYSAWAVMMLGYGLLTESWAVTTVAAAAFAAVVRRTSVEESHLVAQFGEVYKEYAMRTGRFLPHLPWSK
jgi:protein-S-isoprenylcysteine O-methyltransferase Ste14